MKKTWVLLMLSLAALGIYASGCGSSDACASSCQDEQAKSCTDIPDCETFCAALELVAGEGNCNSQLDNYETCLGNGDVCSRDTQCGTAKSSLDGCTTKYCVAHTDEPSCETVTQQSL